MCKIYAGTHKLNMLKYEIKDPAIHGATKVYLCSFTAYPQVGSLREVHWGTSNVLELLHVAVRLAVVVHTGLYDKPISSPQTVDAGTTGCSCEVRCFQAILELSLVIHHYSCNQFIITWRVVLSLRGKATWISRSRSVHARAGGGPFPICSGQPN